MECLLFNFGGIIMVKVSVIMPVYNCEDFLKGSVESILNQTLADLELICVDDGSTDDSLNILLDYAKKDSRVRVFACNHRGGGDARNFALKYVSGEYLYFMDADDLLEFNAFEEFYSISNSKKLDFLIFKAKKYDVVKQILFESNYYNMDLLSNFVKGRIFNFKEIGNLIFDINVTPWCKFYNTKFVLDSNAQFKSASKFHDNQFFWNIIFQAKRIYFLDKFYYVQNIHPKSLIESCGKNHADIIDVINGIIDIFKKFNQFEKFKSMLFNRKINAFVRRYEEISLEYKEFFFIKMKKDFKKIGHGDFRNNLSPVFQYVFDSVLISKDYNDFDVLKKYFYIIYNNSLNIDYVKNWFYGLNENHKMFSLNYIKNDFPEEFYNLVSDYQFKVSVIIPVYNAEKYLENVFNSLLNQSIGFENLQIIFVDNASSDNSSQFIKKYSDSHNNVISIFLNENNKYGGCSYNMGIKYAIADYLMFLNQEDVLSDNACELLYDEISSDDLGLVSGIHRNGNEVPTSISKDTIINHWENLDVCNKKINDFEIDLNFEFKLDSIYECPEVLTYINMDNKIFKKSIIINNNIYFLEDLPSEDFFMFNLFLNVRGIKFINNVIILNNGNQKDLVQHHFSKTSIMNRISSWYMMFSLCDNKDKLKIFIHYFLVSKLKNILLESIFENNFSTKNILDILFYSKLLFELCDGFISDKLLVFEDIADGNFKKVLKCIHGENTPNLSDIKCIITGDNSIKNCENLAEDWVNQFDIIKPDLFIYDETSNYTLILDYCVKHNIATYQVNNFNCYPTLESILDSLNFKYIPNLKQITFFIT